MIPALHRGVKGRACFWSEEVVVEPGHNLGAGPIRSTQREYYRSKQLKTRDRVTACQCTGRGVNTHQRSTSQLLSRVPLLASARRTQTGKLTVLENSTASAGHR
jgi:hypothetical protein